jgi:hypothetical protein
MAEISSYPKIQPKAQDLLLGSRTYVEGVDEFTGNPTSVFTVGAIADLVEQDSGSSLYTTKTVELTPAQMLSLNGDGALELIPAPGAGKIIVVSEIFLFVDYNSVPYDFAAGVSGQGKINFTYGTTIVFSPLNFSSLLNSSSDLYFSASTSIYAEANKPFNLLAHSGVEVTQGDSPVKFSIVYRILNSTTLL